MDDEEKLKLGKGVAFVKSRLKRLPQSEDIWEADFVALPKPIMQTETHYLGMVVMKKGGTLLADLTVHGRPSVNDLATLLAYVWGGRAPRAVAARSDSAIFPGFFSIPCSVFRDGVVTIFRDLS